MNTTLGERPTTKSERRSFFLSGLPSQVSWSFCSAFAASGADSKTTGGAFLIRLETFPFYKFGLKDLAVYANFGAGGLSLDGQDGKRAGGSFASIGGGGIAYELVRLGHFAIAPTAEYLLLASETLTSHQALIGARVVFYGGPS